MNFNFDNERPIYIQLVDNIKILIVSGKYMEGSRLPSVRDLSMEYRVNPNTMQKALTELEDMKLIYTERTNGKFVTTNKKLIEKIKNDLAKEKVRKYLYDMNSIGINNKDAIKYLNEEV